MERIKKRQKLEVKMASTFDELQKIQEKRNYKPGWAFKMAKMKGII
jgi:hypothetical protein